MAALISLKNKKSKYGDTVSYLETRHPVILDGYFAIWTGLGGAGNL